MLGTFIVVVVVVLDEAPAVDINDKAFLVNTQKIEATHCLTKALGDLGCHDGLLLGQRRYVSDLFAIRVTLDNTIDNRRLARLCMDITLANCIRFHILCVFHFQELLVDVRYTGLKDSAGYTKCFIFLRTLVVDLSEQPPSTSAL